MRRCCHEQEQEEGIVRQRQLILRQSDIFLHRDVFGLYRHTVEAGRSLKDGLDDVHHAGQFVSYALVLREDDVPLAKHRLETLVSIFALELLDPLLQSLDPLLLPLADVSLGLAVVGALTLELLWGELGHGA